MKYLIRVQANHDCWIADWDGDPGRTIIREHAKVFRSKNFAKHQIKLYEKQYSNRAFSLEKTL